MISVGPVVGVRLGHVRGGRDEIVDDPPVGPALSVVTSTVDNSMMESFWSTMQRELLDRQPWTTRAELAPAIFEWIEGFYNPVRRHTSIEGLSPVDYETLHTTTATAA